MSGGAGRVLAERGAIAENSCKEIALTLAPGAASLALHNRAKSVERKSVQEGGN